MCTHRSREIEMMRLHTIHTTHSLTCTHVWWGCTWTHTHACTNMYTWSTYRVSTKILCRCNLVTKLCHVILRFARCLLHVKIIITSYKNSTMTRPLIWNQIKPTNKTSPDAAQYGLKVESAPKCWDPFRQNS